ncbi:SIMPL domain-containing protein [Hymenobacter puniceus]|uniref:SIMPL domain-containing protein n=1 Tax=Hymenobacter sp. BT190 TaxID=2763505 RepID=UPI001651AB10|nr:SIMPL domain-containing protein [Hymenobacter sp. BT190]MBC6696831.1 SIMPL domain-containing protein [Hymenobacter sp. BT190]
MTQIKAPALLLALFLLAVVGAVAQSVPKMVQVRGTAMRELAPETAELLLTYRTNDNVRDADRAREQQTRLQTVLREYGVAPEKLTTYNVVASGYGMSKVANSTIALTRQYKLVLDKPALLDELLPKLVQSGADEVVVISLLSSRLEAFRLEVMGLALANARTKAQYTAQQLGLQLGSAHAVREVVPTRPTPGSREEALLKMRGGSTLEEQMSSAESASVSPRAIRVSAAFDVDYEVQ